MGSQECLRVEIERRARCDVEQRCDVLQACCRDVPQRATSKRQGRQEEAKEK